MGVVSGRTAFSLRMAKAVACHFAGVLGLYRQAGCYFSPGHSHEQGGRKAEGSDCGFACQPVQDRRVGFLRLFFLDPMAAI